MGLRLVCVALARCYLVLQLLLQLHLPDHGVENLHRHKLLGLDLHPKPATSARGGDTRKDVWVIVGYPEFKRGFRGT